MAKKAKNNGYRPPIVAVLGHVDHGKTTLLDYIRKTNVAGREAGGITQRIGAYQVETKEGEKITFLDTPGHQAFWAMRSRGATVADLVVLVVAADDGAKPQTRESLEHIKRAKVPYLIALTKIDLPQAEPERVKNELAKEGINLEGRGGDIVVVPVSGKTGEGVESLLEMISLISQLHEVSGDPKAALSAVVIETKLDSRRGPVVSVVVRNGRLALGEEIQAENVAARVRALFDESGKPLKEVLPGQPAEILGFETLPPVGAKVSFKTAAFKEEILPQKPKSQEEGGFPIIIKADTTGSLEALVSSLPTGINLFSSGIGDISLSDVLAASAAQAAIVGFNVKVPGDVVKLAESEGVLVQIFKVIYELIEELEKIAQGKTILKTQEKILGRAEIIAEFPYGEKERIAGARVLEGRIAKGDKIHLARDGKTLADVSITSMRRVKENITKAQKGEEFGAFFAGSVDFQIGDMLESFQPAQQKAS